MDNAVLMQIGQRVRDLRKQMNLSQEQLGELAGFHFSYIGGLERGQKNVTLLNLERIALALEVPMYELFSYERQFYRNNNNNKDTLLREIYEKLIGFDQADLKKIQRILDELFT